MIYTHLILHPPHRKLGQVWLCTLANGVELTVLGGPIIADDYTWWRLKAPADVVGWAVDDYLQRTSPRPAEGAPLAEEKPSGPEAGQRFVQAQGCLGCHTIDGSVLVGPTWLGLFGSTRKFTDGVQTTADREYLYRFIVDPNAQVVNGFTPGIMPQDYGNRLNEDEIQAIIDYIESLD